MVFLLALGWLWTYCETKDDVEFRIPLSPLFLAGILGLHYHTVSLWSWAWTQALVHGGQSLQLSCIPALSILFSLSLTSSFPMCAIFQVFLFHEFSSWVCYHWRLPVGYLRQAVFVFLYLFGTFLDLILGSLFWVITQRLLKHIRKMHPVTSISPLARRCCQTDHTTLFDFSANAGLSLPHFDGKCSLDSWL